MARFGVSIVRGSRRHHVVIYRSIHLDFGDRRRALACLTADPCAYDPRMLGHGTQEYRAVGTASFRLFAVLAVVSYLAHPTEGVVVVWEVAGFE